MANIGKLNVVLVASTGPFGKSMAKAQRITQQFVGHAKRFGTSISGIMQNMWKRAAVFAALVGGTLIYGLKKAADSIDDVTKASRRLLGNDGATGALAGLRLSASLAGVEAAALDKGLEKMLETISKADEGDMAAVEALERIGVTAKQLKALSPEKRLEAVAAGIQKIGDAGDRIAAARGIFGKAGGGLLSLFEGGAKAIADATREAELFGLSVSKASAGAVEKMNDNFTRISAVVEGAFIQAISRIAPVVNEITDALLAQIEAIGGVGNAVETAFNYMIKQTGYAIDKVDELHTAWLKVKRAILSATASDLSDAQLGQTGTGRRILEHRAKQDAAEQKMREGQINPKRLEEYRRQRDAAGVNFKSPEEAARISRAKDIAEIDRQIAAKEKDRKENGTLGDKFKKFVYDARRKAEEQAANFNPSIPDALGDSGATAKGSNITAQAGNAKLIAFNGPTFAKDNIAKQSLDVLKTIADNTANKAAVLA